MTTNPSMSSYSIVAIEGLSSDSNRVDLNRKLYAITAAVRSAIASTATSIILIVDLCDFNLCNIGDLTTLRLYESVDPI